ncbi:MAG: hypothetical protein NTZ36_02100 [Candidatus Jorgensenbacteria bacterium]|nr:hypothetical protein [Candidatus Jorgensenbacteria bacterium]
MKDLSVFYGINWIENVPQIFVVSDRKSINLLRGKKTESWFVAWAENRTRIIYILDKNGFKKNSSHKYSDEYYSALIKHEISHLFYRILSSGFQGPVWLSEGVAISTSGQTSLKNKPSELKNFLEFYSKTGSGVYEESGFFIEALVKEFGDGKLLELIKSLSQASDEAKFNKVFKKIYGFSLSYSSANKIYKK